jgi:hypothetical protein
MEIGYGNCACKFLEVCHDGDALPVHVSFSPI